jgi:hypothetical protein
MAGGKNIKVKRLRVSNRDAAGNYVIRILTLNGITTYTIIADAEETADRRRRRRYDIISSLESETLAAASLFFN